MSEPARGVTDSGEISRDREDVPPRVVVETIHLRKEFEDVVAVTDLNFSIVNGSIFGLLGPNGAGKSTVIEMLDGARRRLRRHA